MKLKNARPDAYEIVPVAHGDYTIMVEAGGTFDADEALAYDLLQQDGNYEPADAEAQAVADRIASEREQRDEVLAAEDVGDINARDLIASLDAMTPDELAAVRAQEEAGKHRATVLRRIEELTNDSKGA